MIKTIALKNKNVKLITTTLLAFALLVGGFFVTSSNVFAETPEVRTNVATNITTSDAKLHAMNGDANATGHSFWISTTSGFDTSTSNIPAGVYSTPDMGPISANTAFDAQLSIITTYGLPGNITEITPNTTYYYVAWVKVNGDWYHGEELSFTTNPLDTTGSKFIYNPEYLRANSSKDDAVHVMVPAGTTAVKFLYTDGTTFYTGTGYEHFQGNQFPTPSGKHQYRGIASLPIGTYTATGEFEIADDWYPIEGSTTVYALGQPTGSFVIPSETNSIFRPTDNPARIKASDLNNSFADVTFTVDEVSYSVKRNKCDLREEGNYVLCNVNASDTWTKDLSDDTHTISAIIYNKARNHTSVASKSFVIDSTRPEVTNFKLNPEESPYDTSITASADVTASSGVKGVVFYITEPREDGVCTGNGNKIVQVTGTLTPDTNTYSGTLDTSDLTGDYCVNVIAENMAAGHSAIQRKKVTIDNSPVTPPSPTLTITAPEENGEVAGEYTFKANYENGPTNSISWAIRKYSPTCSKAGGAIVAGNVDGKHNVLDFNNSILSVTLDTKDWGDGEYCFVINPTNVSSLRVIQNFKINNTSTTNPGDVNDDEEEDGDDTTTTQPPAPTISRVVSGGSFGGGGSTGSITGGEVLGAETFQFTQYLKLGSRGGDVPELQKYLNEAGYNSGIVDGIFGPITRKAVIAFQKVNNLIGDGIVGPLTRAVLNSR